MTIDGFQARLRAIWHKVMHPTHKVLWRTKIGKICPGDITCETCNKIIWCRMLELSNKELNKRINNGKNQSSKKDK